MAGVKGKSGAKKGRIVDWNVGRKATGKVRNINLNIYQKNKKINSI